MSDEALISKLLQQDQHAFRHLINTYQGRVVRTANGLLHNKEDAEDVAQEVFVEVYKSLATFRQDSSLSTWIYRITINKALNLQKKNARHQVLSSLEQWFHVKSDSKDNQLADKQLSPDSALVGNERSRVLDKAIQSLPEKQKIAFTLHKIEELSHKEIAEIMKSSVSSVESLIFRAKQNLQQKLSTYFRS